MTDPTTQWEYYIEYLTADSKPQDPSFHQFVREFYPQGDVPPYAIQSILRRLNQLGALGWELVALDPIMAVLGDGTVVPRSEGSRGTNTYLSVFKRRKA